MDSLSILSFCALGIALAGILLVFLVYPLCLWLCARRQAALRAEASLEPRVSMLVAVRNAEACIGEKIRNSLDLDYPGEQLEIVVVSDGSTDSTEAIVRSFDDRRVKLRASSRHDGKTEALNQGIHSCSGEIVVFSDADAILERGALRKLTRHFSDPGVGGVCGQRGIQERKAALAALAVHALLLGALHAGLVPLPQTTGAAPPAATELEIEQIEIARAPTTSPAPAIDRLPEAVAPASPPAARVAAQNATATAEKRISPMLGCRMLVPLPRWVRHLALPVPQLEWTTWR